MRDSRLKLPAGAGTHYAQLRRRNRLITFSNKTAGGCELSHTLARNTVFLNDSSTMRCYTSNTPQHEFGGLMPSLNPRVVTNISPHYHRLMSTKLDDTGVSASEYLRRLIITDLEGHQNYMVKLMGHRLMQASVHLAALSKDRFSEQEFAHLRTLAADIGVAAFGPLPVRPYDFDRPAEVRAKLQILHDLLDGF